MKLIIFITVFYISSLALFFISKGVILYNALLCICIFSLGMFFSYAIFHKYVYLGKKINVPELYPKILCYSVLFLQIFAIYNVIHNGFTILNHRNLVFSDPTYLFSSPTIFTLYFSFFIPLIIMYGIRLIVNKDAKTMYFKLILMILFLDSVIMLGRFQLLFIIFLLLTKNIYERRKLFKVYIILGVLLIFSQAIIYFRQFFAYGNVSFSEVQKTDQLKGSIFDYQFMGFVVLDDYIIKNSYLGHWWDFMTLNFPIYLSSLIVNNFGILLYNPWEVFNLKLSEGFYFSDYDLYINAFSTNFLPIFHDFGLIGIFSFGLLSGFVFSLKGDNNTLNFTKILLFFLLFFGLYQPLILGLLGFLLILLIFFLFINLKLIQIK